MKFRTTAQCNFRFLIPLKYSATFRVRKFESLFHEINRCLQKTTTYIGLLAEQNILCKYLIHIFFQFWAWLFLAVPFLCYFQKLQLLLIKKFWKIFCCTFLLFVWAQKACLRFLKSYFRLEILIFLSFEVSFLVDTFN